MIRIVIISKAYVEAGSWLSLHLLFRLGIMIKHLQSTRELKATPSIFLLLLNK